MYLDLPDETGRYSYHFIICKKIKVKQIIIIILGFLMLTGCIGKESSHNTAGGTSGQMSGEKEDAERLTIVFMYDTVPFFGEMLVMDDSAHIMQQIKSIADKDKMLAVKDNVLTIGKVPFGINLRSNGIDLISSTCADDPRMKSVIKYIDGLYEPDSENGSEDYYWWHHDKVFQAIRMRPLHSEEGGIALMIN